MHLVALEDEELFRIIGARLAVIGDRIAAEIEPSLIQNLVQNFAARNVSKEVKEECNVALVKSQYLSDGSTGLTGILNIQNPAVISVEALPTESIQPSNPQGSEIMREAVSYSSFGTGTKTTRSTPKLWRCCHPMKEQGKLFLSGSESCMSRICK